MVKKLVLIFAFVAMVPVHALAAGTRWVADYMGGAPLTSLQFPTYGPLSIHVEFVPEFQPAPGTTIQPESVVAIDFVVPGAPGFAAPWGGPTLMFQLKLDLALNVTNWWVIQTVYLDGAPATTNYQVAGTYKDGADGEGFWDTAFVMDASGNYTLVGHQDSAAGAWTLSQVPEASTGSLILLGLVLLLLQFVRRDRQSP